MRYAIKIDNKTESKFVQEILFKMGYKWYVGNNVYLDYNASHLIIDPIKELIGFTTRTPMFLSGPEILSFEEFIIKIENTTFI